MNQGTLKSYVLGFIGSLILTLLSFFLVSQHFFNKMHSDLITAALAVLQAWFFLILYLQLGRGKKDHWSVVVFLFMVLVTVLLVGGSIWIMHHLDYNLMPHS